MQEPVNGIDRNSYYNEEYIDGLFPQMKEKFFDNGIPVIVGEYGASLKTFDSPTLQEIHNKSYVYYHKYVVENLKKYGMVPFLWDNGSLFTYEIKQELQWEGIKVAFDTAYPYRAK